MKHLRVHAAEAIMVVLLLSVFIQGGLTGLVPGVLVGESFSFNADFYFEQDGLTYLVTPGPGINASVVSNVVSVNGVGGFSGNSNITIVGVNGSGSEERVVNVSIVPGMDSLDSAYENAMMPVDEDVKTEISLIEYAHVMIQVDPNATFNFVNDTTYVENTAPDAGSDGVQVRWISQFNAWEGLVTRQGFMKLVQDGAVTGVYTTSGVSSSSFGTLAVCGQTITGNTVQTSNVATSSHTCITIGADDITLDCDGFNLTGTDAIGVGGIKGFIAISNKNNVTIKNCNLYNPGRGIHVANSANLTVINTGFYNSSVAVLAGGNAGEPGTQKFEDAVFDNVTVYANTSASVSGILLGTGSERNTIQNSFFNYTGINTGYLVSISGLTSGAFASIGNRVVDSEFHNAFDAISVLSGTNAFIARNSVTGTYRCLGRVTATGLNSSYINNTVRCRSVGLSQSSGYFTAIGNNISYLEGYDPNFFDSGIYIGSGVTSAYIKDNIVSGYLDTGVWSVSPNVQLINNKIFHNRVGFNTTSGGGGYLFNNTPALNVSLTGTGAAILENQSINNYFLSSARLGARLGNVTHLYTGLVSASGQGNLANFTLLSNHFADVDTSVVGGVTGNVSFFNVSFDFPAIIRNGAVCPADTCRMIGLDNNIASFNVTGFSNYTVGPGNASIIVTLLEPSGDLNVLRNEGFNVSINVSCNNASCGQVEISLDPEPYLPELEFNRTYGSTGFEFGSDFVELEDGTYVLFGRTSSFGAGGNDFWFVRINRSGELIWNRSVGGTGSEEPGDVMLMDDGSVVGIGYTTSFGAGSLDYFLARVNHTGELVWNVTFGAAGVDSGKSVVALEDGTIMAVGESDIGAGSRAVYLVHLNHTGDLIFNETYGGSGSEDAGDIVELRGGDVAIIGDTSSFGAGSTDIYLLRVNRTGSLIQNETFGGTSTEEGKGVIELIDGYAIVGRTATFGAGSSDYWVLRLDNTMGQVWNTTLGGGAIEIPESIDYAHDGYVIGGYSTTFGPGDEDHWMVKVNTTGSHVWNFTLGGASSQDRGMVAYRTRDGGYASFGDSSSFGAGSNDFFFGKFSSEAKILVPDFSGAQPFWTNTTNPLNFTLLQGESVVVNWFVNATGPINRSYEFFAFANATANRSVGGESTYFNVTILNNTVPQAPVVGNLSTVPALPTTINSTQTLNLSVNFTVDVFPVNVTFVTYNSTGAVHTVGPVVVSSGSLILLNYSVPAQPDGSYSINMSVVNENGTGLIVALGNYTVFTPDVIDPVVGNISVNDSMVFTNNETAVNLSVNFTVDAFPVNVTFVTYNSTEAVHMQGPDTVLNASGFPVTYGIPALLPGNYVVNMTVFDSSGNNVTVNVANLTIVGIQGAIPVIGNVSLNPTLPQTLNSSTSINVSVSFTSSEYPINVTFNISNSSSVVVNVQGPRIVSLVALATENFTIPLGLADGFYNVDFIVEDNESNTVVQRLGNFTIFTPDTFAPNITSVNTVPVLPQDVNRTLGLSVGVNFSSDEYPINITFSLYNNSGAVSVQGPYVVTSAGGVHNFSIPSGLALGNYSVNMTATDISGNSVVVGVGNFSVVAGDVSAPLLGNVSANFSTNHSSNTTVGVNVNFTSNEFPVNVTFNTYGPTTIVQGPIVVNSSSEIPIVYTIPENLSNGFYTVNMTIQDVSGNNVTVVIGNYTVFGATSSSSSATIIVGGGGGSGGSNRYQRPALRRVDRSSGENTDSSGEETSTPSVETPSPSTTVEEENTQEQVEPVNRPTPTPQLGPQPLAGEEPVEEIAAEQMPRWPLYIVGFSILVFICMLLVSMRE